MRTEKYQKLFDHLEEEHGLVLLESQMDEINNIINKVSIPDGFVVMPKRLTYENGAKALLMGEFAEVLEDEDNPGNPFIVPISWDKIKDIYKMAVKHFTTENQN